jgi:hypothetical protein
MVRYAGMAKMTISKRSSDFNQQRPVTTQSTRQHKPYTGGKKALDAGQFGVKDLHQSERT